MNAPPAAAAAPLAAAADPAYDTGAAGWSRRVAQRPLDHDEQRELVSHLQRTETESARGEAQLEHVEREHREVERGQLAAVQTLIGRLAHYTRYSRTCTVELAADAPVRQYLISEFQRTATQHRGPMPADPPRQVPKFDVRRVQQISNPRAQEAYMAELQDTAGLCERRVTALEMDALKVKSDEQLELNEFMLYHGSDARRFERLCNQGLDPRYAGSNAGKLVRSCVSSSCEARTHACCYSRLRVTWRCSMGWAPTSRPTRPSPTGTQSPTTQVSSASSWCARYWPSRTLRPCR